MKNNPFTAAYLGFFALIGFAIYVTESAIPLFAILIMPSFHDKEKKKAEDANIYDEYD
jgi:hypothetical protein